MTTKELMRIQVLFAKNGIKVGGNASLAVAL